MKKSAHQQRALYDRVGDVLRVFFRVKRFQDAFAKDMATEADKIFKEHVANDATTSESSDGSEEEKR